MCLVSSAVEGQETGWWIPRQGRWPKLTFLWSVAECYSTVSQLITVLTFDSPMRSTQKSQTIHSPLYHSQIDSVNWMSFWWPGPWTPCPQTAPARGDDLEKCPSLKMLSNSLHVVAAGNYWSNAQTCTPAAAAFVEVGAETWGDFSLARATQKRHTCLGGHILDGDGLSRLVEWLKLNKMNACK